MEKEKRLIDVAKAFSFLKGKKVKETGAFSKGVNKGLNIALAALHNSDAIPTVDAAPVVHGRWEPELMPTGVEYTGYEEMTVQALRCSECGIFIDVSEGHFSFCPYCGAKMGGGAYGEENT